MQNLHIVVIDENPAHGTAIRIQTKLCLLASASAVLLTERKGDFVGRPQLPSAPCETDQKTTAGFRPLVRHGEWYNGVYTVVLITME